MAMKHMKIDELTVRDLFQGDYTTFAVPIYQRKYAWEEDQCLDLWNDLTDFAFPETDDVGFNESDSEYSLGDVYAHLNDRGEEELIDGQQRITTLILLMRAFYEDLRDRPIGVTLARCIWHTNEDETIDTARPRIVSYVLTDKDKNTLKEILVSGRTAKKDDSLYAQNYRLFQAKIAEFKDNRPSELETLAARILKNAWFLRQRADSVLYAQDTFLKRNTRGKSLEVSDIFKAILHEEAFNQDGEKGALEFNKRWEILFDKCTALFAQGKDLSEISFAFWLRTYKDKFLRNYKNLNRYYTKNNAIILKSPYVLKDIEGMIDFIRDLYTSNSSFYYPDETKRKAYILFRCNKTGIFHALANYYFKKRDIKGNIDIGELNSFFDRFIAYNLSTALTKNKRWQTEYYHINSHTDYLIYGTSDISIQVSHDEVKSAFDQMIMLKDVTRRDKAGIILTWWTFKNENQQLPPLKDRLHIEHIFSQSLSSSLTEIRNVNLFGNLALLEPVLNQKAQNYSFSEKRKVYLNGTSKGKRKDGTFNEELKLLATTQDQFDESDILARNKQILNAVIAFLDSQDLLLR